jgi:uncharacterized protein YllA (UPF0747 family)
VRVVRQNPLQAGVDLREPVDHDAARGLRAGSTRYKITAERDEPASHGKTKRVSLNYDGAKFAKHAKPMTYTRKTEATHVRAQLERRFRGTLMDWDLFVRDA